MTEPRVALVPDLSVISLTLDALLGEGEGVPEWVRLRLLTAIRTRAGRDSLRPILVGSKSGRRQMPSAVAPLTPTGDLPIEEQVEALRANHGDRLLDDLADIYPDRLPAAWRTAAANPARWSNALADLATDVWTAMGRDAWLRARPLFDREFRRVGVALARGDRHALLNSLSSRIAYTDDIFSLDGRVDVPVDGRQVVLAPMISAPGSIVVERDDPTAIVLGYAIPDGLRVWDSAQPEVPPTSDALATIIGQGRADVLRALERQRTMGELATQLTCAPSTVTHHCDTLEAAGLVERNRRGKSVRVWRTQRGAELVDLFS